MIKPLARHWDRAALGIFLVLWVGFVAWRVQTELAHAVKGGFSRGLVATRWDPRGASELDHIVRTRESESFREELRSGNSHSTAWPGLASMQVSFAWLELTQGLHNPASYEGNFSWMFSKLHTVIRRSSPQEIDFVGTLAPFFYVLGQDPIGATVVMNETLHRAPRSWIIWFWSGYHAMENLANPRLAGDIYGRAALMPYVPPYVAALAARLSLGQQALNSGIRRELLEKQLPPELLEKVKAVRPEYFR